MTNLNASPTPGQPDAETLYQSNALREHREGRLALAALQQAKLPTGVERAPVRVKVGVDESIPALAWLTSIREGGKAFVRVGRGVELSGTSAFEGVWDGPFSGRTGFAHSQFVYGSGVAWGDGLTFVPPKHSWEYLFVLVDQERKRTLVSNSMNFALEVGGVPPGELMASIARDLFDKTNAATKVGIDKYDPLVASDGRFTFYRMIFYNFTADAEGHIDLLPVPEPEAPYSDFATYRAYLVAAIDRIARNATDAERKRPLPPITPVSNGYDSACVAVLAKDAGWDEAVTLDVEVKGRSDSGIGIAQRLGLKMTPVQHPYGKVVPELAGNVPSALKGPSYEFLATPGLGDDIAFLAMEKAISGRTVFSGALGDSIWRRNSTLPPGLPVRVVYGKSLTEYRLRAGFAFVPVPSIGARFPRRAKRITRSEEMQPWTLWRAYDRPFARRVVEEQGVPREEFGIAKAATSPTISNRQALFAEAVRAIRGRYAPVRPTTRKPAGEKPRSSPAKRMFRGLKTRLLPS